MQVRCGILWILVILLFVLANVIQGIDTSSSPPAPPSSAVASHTPSPDPVAAPQTLEFLENHEYSILLVSVPLFHRVSQVVAIGQSLLDTAAKHNAIAQVTLATCSHFLYISELEENQSSRKGQENQLMRVAEFVRGIDARIHVLTIGDCGSVLSARWSKRAESATKGEAFAVSSLAQFAQLYVPMYYFMSQNMDPLLKHQPQFDLVVSDVMTFLGLDLADHLLPNSPVPCIVSVPSALTTIPSAVIAYETADHIPSFWSTAELSTESIFWTLLRRTVAGPGRVAVRLALAGTLQKHVNEIRSRLLGDAHEPWSLWTVLMNRTLLINSVWGFEYPRPYSPLVHMVGSLAPVRHGTAAAGMLDQLDRFIAKNRGRRIVYVRMGPEYELTSPALHVALSSALARLIDAGDIAVVILRNPSFASIRSVGDRMLEKRYRHVHFQRRYPVLIWSEWDDHALDAADLVISSCSQQTAIDGMQHGTQLLCIPLWEDQLAIGIRVFEAGVGSYISCKSDPHSFADSILYAVKGERIRYNESHEIESSDHPVSEDIFAYYRAVEKTTEDAGGIVLYEAEFGSNEAFRPAYYSLHWFTWYEGEMYLLCLLLILPTYFCCCRRRNKPSASPEPAAAPQPQADAGENQDDDQAKARQRQQNNNDQSIKREDSPGPANSPVRRRPGRRGRR